MRTFIALIFMIAIAAFLQEAERLRQNAIPTVVDATDPPDDPLGRPRHVTVRGRLAMDRAPGTSPRAGSLGATAA